MTNVADVGFGAITTFASDLTRSQNVCAYATGAPPRYSITGRGSGASNAFTLSNGTSTLPFEVQWNASPNQTSGTAMFTGVALTGLTSVGVTPSCTLSVTPSGSLTIILRATELAKARAGVFTGTLSLMLAPN